MTATIDTERQQAEINKEQGTFAIFQGRNLLRFIIAGWPKIAQQFVGLSVFNTYATYFCKWFHILLSAQRPRSPCNPQSNMLETRIHSW
jgi:hypothetical protein